MQPADLCRVATSTWGCSKGIVQKEGIGRKALEETVGVNRVKCQLDLIAG
jgi:hypothetical protein